MNKKRGEYGYIAARKKKTLLGTIIIALIGVAIFLVGLFLNKMSNRNLFTIIAVLAVLPAAKHLLYCSRLRRPKKNVIRKQKI